jgi:hypothetical protein
VKLDARRAGEALRSAAGDLARVWRASRFSAGLGVFPGAHDGVMEEFLERVGEALLLDDAPQDVWAATHGPVRVMPDGRALEMLLAEWRLARAVLSSACDALGVNAAATERVLKLADDAAAAAPALLAGQGPPGVLLVHQLGGFRPRAPEPYGDGPR